MPSDLISLAVVDGEPRVDSRLIASQLGVEHQNTRELIQQYQADFEEFGILRFETGEIKGRGQPQKFALLNEDQSYLLLTYTQNTPQARELKKRLVRSFSEHRRHATLPRFRPERTRKALPGKLTVEQQDAIKALVKSRVEVLPHDGQAKAAITCWSAIKSKFGVSYKEVPAEQFTEVLSLVARLELDKAAPKALPLDLNYPLESARPPEGCNGLAYYAFAQAKDWVDPNWELLMKLRAAGFNVDGPIYSHQAKIHVMAAMYHGLIGKAVESLNVAGASLAYAPIYLR